MSKSDDVTPGAVRLDSLAPKFSSTRHGIYLSALEHAIDQQPATRNIALAGAYGVGKSSVLGELARRRPNQVINISLLTLGVEPEAIDSNGGENPAARTTSNRIQKEIVKQLLYQQSPAKAKQSRFRRIDRLNWGREVIYAASAGLLILAFIIISGVAAPILAQVGLQVPTPPQSLRLTTFAIGAAVFASLVVMLVRMIARGRIGIDKVTAGPATISLPPRSASYFDEYLDEIIYFFETNPRRNIVIIEDLDRFNDAKIYESLHSLNGLLNAAHQLKKRNIRFVYAVRDSVFEKLGRPASDGNIDDTRAELGRGNRTKFFELIIPMVPFITHKNARELMHQTLTQRGHTISRNLIDVTARHVPDMRLIHNIINEFDVFKRHLLDVPTPVPELDAERLLAMIVFKNTQAADFEEIRHGTSSLDRLFDTWREFVEENLDEIRDNNNTLRSHIAREAGADDHASDLAQRLRSQIDMLASVPGSGLASKVIKVDGVQIDDDTLQTASFWRDLLQKEKSLTLTAQHTRYTSHQDMTLEAAAIESLTAIPLDNARWISRSIAADRDEMRRNDDRVAFLRRHTWQALMERTGFRYERDDSGALTFRQWAEEILPSQLVLELVAHGYITSYFPLHVSSFYGQLIRPDAMTYIMRNVDHGTSDPEFPLAPQDVDAILVDQGRTVLTERSMRNVSILDRLLVSDDEAAIGIVRLLPADEPDGPAFIDRYLSAGCQKDMFVAALTPYAPNIYAYLIGDAPLELEERTRLISIAIKQRGDLDYDLPFEVRVFLEENVAGIPVLSDERQSQSAAHGIEFLVDSGAVLSSVALLSDSAKSAIRETRAYQMNATNLADLSNSKNFALDLLQDASAQIYQHAIDLPEKYLSAREELAASHPTIEDPANFVDVLDDAKEWPLGYIEVLVREACAASRVDSLLMVPKNSWPAIVKYRRTNATFDNVLMYVDQFTGLDAHLGAMLADVDELTDFETADDGDRVRIALAIINTSTDFLDDSRRVKLAASVQPGTLEAASIEPQRGTLIGRLLEAGLVKDDVDAFSERLMLDWPTQEYAISQSAAFTEIVGPSTVQKTHIAPLMHSEVIPESTQAAMVAAVGEYSTVPRDVYDAIATCALRGRVILDGTAIEMVRRGGTDSDTVLELLAQSGPRVQLEELRHTLRALGGVYALIADPGTQRPKLEATEAIRAVLARLKEAGIVSRVKDEAAGHLRVTLHRS